jgi:hypothetical protein
VPHLDSGLMRAVRIQSANADLYRPALIDGNDPSRTLSHGWLAARVDEVAATLPPVTSGRRLVQVPLSAEVDIIIG